MRWERQQVGSLFKKILVPLDFTSKNDAALRVAADLAKQNDAHVTLIHVIEKIEYADEEEIASFYESLKQRARTMLRACAEGFHRAMLPVTEEVVLGNTTQTVVNYATENQIDLVVLSSHRVNLDEPPKGWATLSYQLSILCQCPVMLVK